MNEPDQNMLKVEKLTMQFGGIKAVQDLSFDVPQGKIFSLIGPNGAGKTTAFNAITGIYEPTNGKILFRGKEQRKPVSPIVIVRGLLIALMSGIAGMILLGNIALLWVTCVNALNNREDFSWRRSWNAFVNYHTSHGLNVLETTSTEFPYAVNYGTNQAQIEIVQFGDIKKFDEYKQRLSEMREQRKSAPRAKQHEIEAEFQRFISEYNESIRPQLTEMVAKVEILLDAPSQQAIDDFKVDLPFAPPSSLDLIETFKAESRSRHWKQVLGFLGGIIVGAFGYWTIWNRSRRTPDVIGLSGMARTFQNIRLFKNMTVCENVMIGLDRKIGGNVFSMAFRTPGQRSHERQAQKQACETLNFVGLEHRANRTAGSLPYGEQRRLEIARALATEPKLLLLDEPGAGMNPSETAELMELIRKIRDTGVTVLLIEHHMNVVMGISDHIVVMDQGQKIAEGTPEEVRNNPKVIEAYLGKEELG